MWGRERDTFEMTCNMPISDLKVGDIIDNSIVRWDDTIAISYIRKIEKDSKGYFSIEVYNDLGHYLYTFYGYEEDSIKFVRVLPRTFWSPNEKA